MVKIGSHNSWSYASPIKWYIPHFVCKCQSLDIPTQYRYGVSLFDLRLRLKEDGTFGAAHGAAIFDVLWEADLEWLNSQERDIYIRVILEYNSKPKDEDIIINKFINQCQFLEQLFPRLRFFGGLMKYSWKTLYRFKTEEEEPVLLDFYSSTTSWFKSSNKFLRIIDDWWPWLYARFHNHKNVEKYLESGSKEFLFIDFIEIL